MRVFVASALLLALVTFAGCARERGPRAKESRKDGDVYAKEMPQPKKDAGYEFVNADDPAVAPAKENPALPRKIKYSADIRLIVNEFEKAQEGVTAAVKDADGLVAQSEVGGSTGQARSGRWKIRVPVKQFEKFRDAVLRLGDVEQNRTDSEDVTEEYYDLEAHIKNRQSEKNRSANCWRKARGT